MAEKSVRKPPVEIVDGVRVTISVMTKSADRKQLKELEDIKYG